MKKTILKYLIRISLLLVIATGLLIIVVTQPVISSTDYKKPLTEIKNLRSHVYMLSETLIKTIPVAELIARKEAYIYLEVSKLTKHVKYQAYDVMGVEYNNIVVSFKGTKNCGTYIIGAHFDTYGNLPGADDNSSGTAGLLELARLFSANKPVCDIQLVFFNLEEPPYFRSEHMGSYVHAKNLNETNTPVEMMISLEMIGFFSDQANSQSYPIPGMQYMYSDIGNYITIVGDLSQIGVSRKVKKSMRSATNLPVYSINAPKWIAGIDFSDQLNYWAFGYPAIMITDTAFNRNKNYHTKNDTAEKLDYHRMAKVVDATYYTIKTLSTF